MQYLITDGENKTWGNVQWSENITHEQNNPNYLFSTYTDPILAHLLNPAYEGYNNPCIWTAEGEITNNFGLRYECRKITSIEKLDVKAPTNEQRISFAILCATHLVNNTAFKMWAKNYLLGNNKTKETADLVRQQLEKIEIVSTKEQDGYVGPAIACIMAITVDANMFAANAAHRTYYDSPENDRIDLVKIARIATSLKPEEIAEVL
jgi:hypothetical protein